MLMELQSDQKERVGRAAAGVGLDFDRLFGSFLKSPEGDLDVDLAVGASPLDLEGRSRFVSACEDIFGRPVDLVGLRPGLPPLLIREIACRSAPLWESGRGRERYAVLVDRLLAVAEDDLRAVPDSLREEAFRRVQERLRVP
jgi:predicted nucleotidyltransferase